ncbi:hypothetical protein JCM10213v2_003645 [Rhodosporidiobolus nylandii]
MSFLALPPELKLKIFEMVDAQDKAYRARVERKHRQGEYGRGLRVLSVLSREVRELVAPMLFSPLDLGRVKRRHQAACLKSDALSSCRTLCLRMRDPRASSQDRAQDGRFLLRALCVAKEAKHVLVDLNSGEHWQLVEGLVGPYPSDSGPESLAWYARLDKFRTKGVWAFAETFAPEFRRRLADVHEWMFRGDASAVWLGLEELDPISSNVPAVAQTWLNWPHPLPLLLSLTLSVQCFDTSVLAFKSRFPHTLRAIYITGASSPIAQPATASLPEFPSFTRLSLLRLSLPTIHDHTAVLQALEPYLPALASLTCTSTAVTTSADSAAAPFPALF